MARQLRMPAARLLSECLAMETQRRLNSQEVLDVLRDLFVERGTPA